MGSSSSSNIDNEKKCAITENTLISENMINKNILGSQLIKLLENCDIYDENDKDMDIYTHAYYKFIYIDENSKADNLIYLENFEKICLEIDKTFYSLMKRMEKK